MDPQELVPLEAGLARPHLPLGGRKCQLSTRSCYRAPLRLCRLLALLICLPTMCITIPLYLRYRVYSGQMYPMSMTDMRLIDNRISTTWCQRQVVRSNATFNAFLVPGPPEMMQELVPVSMTRELELEDDMKEYWGFYLLKGSSVTVSTCVRYPGASLIMIKGYKHLQQCAYIGDDSSEEVDELVEAYNLGLMSNTTLIEKLKQLNKVDGKANQPDAMRRHKAGVSFHDPSNTANVTSSSSESFPTIDITDHDPKELREILEHLHALRQAGSGKVKIPQDQYKPPPNIVALPALHRHRDANVDRDERRWLSFEDIDGNNSEIVINTNDNKIDPKPVGKQVNVLPKEVDNTVKEQEVSENVIQRSTEVDTTTTNAVKPNIETTSERQTLVKEVSTEYTTLRDNPNEPNSREVFEDVLKRLQALGDRGKRVLLKLHQSMGVQYEETPKHSKDALMSAVSGSSEELDRLRKVLVEAIDEEKTRPQRQQKRRDAREQARTKRDSMLTRIELEKEFNEDDEARDFAAEEGVQADGYAEHHVQLNETTAFDMSNSEFWSSFSSSEEALLECEGLILNLPLTPHSACVKGASEDDSFSAAKVNALTYRVPANGYYFFVFNSENEKQRNYIRARFAMHKARYDVLRTALRNCTEARNQCRLPLDFLSAQKVVLEVPLRDNESLWNEQFVIISECEPRTSIYMFCVIAVPILIMMFAFQ